MSLIRALGGIASAAATPVPGAIDFGFVFRLTGTIDAVDVLANDIAAYPNDSWSNGSDTVTGGWTQDAKPLDYDNPGAGGGGSTPTDSRYNGYAYLNNATLARLGFKVNLPAGNYEMAISFGAWQSAAAGRRCEVIVDGGAPTMIDGGGGNSDVQYIDAVGKTHFTPDSWIADEPTSRLALGAVASDVEVVVTTPSGNVAPSLCSVRFYALP